MQMRDVMGGAQRIERQVHEHGFVALLDVMPRMVPSERTADVAAVQAARVSVGQGTKSESEDRDLIRYMISGGYHGKCAHTSPFEMIEFKWHMAMPIFVARQFIRHRVANVNEFSARYSVLPDVFFRPEADDIRKQSKSNKQGSDGAADSMVAEEFLEYLKRGEEQYAGYEAAAAGGVAREMARIGLPLSIYTQWYWKIDLHNLLHFLLLRTDSHAQKEIRDFADPMLELIEPIVPVAVAAWKDYKRDSVVLSAMEVEAIRSGKPINSSNRREQEAFAQKRARLGL